MRKFSKNLRDFVGNHSKPSQKCEISTLPPLNSSPKTYNASPLSPDPLQLRYDVFISFRGEDTRRTFTSHLYHALEGAGISTFLDAEELRQGDDISLQLLRSIQSCRVSVVVFSRNFADSAWCLRELEEILNMKHVTGHIVLPVFFHIDPSDLRRQQGAALAQAFVQHGRRFVPQKVARWKAALVEAGNLSGWVIGPREDEARIIEEIVRRILVSLDDHTHLHVASFPVGLGSRLQDIDSYLLADSHGVKIIGILGMGGIGKTTIAKAVYNKLYLHFEGKSFLANVRENSTLADGSGIVRLQQQLLRDTTNFRKIEIRITNVDMGTNMIKRRLCHKRVLIILDDASDPDQVRNLAGGHHWFGPGSQIIITTRYLDLLKTIKVDKIFEAKPLNDEESLQLLCSHAFGHQYPRDEFKELSEEVVSYCKGLPLALEVVGGSLVDKTVEEWKNTLEKLRAILDHRIQAKLRVSFDSLGCDDRLKELFLDIACFFLGCDKDYVVRILEGCGLFARKGIRDLMDKGLLDVDEKNKLKMHDFVRDMGREIVRETSTGNPGKRSRLWLQKDILSMLRSHLGTEEVEGIALNLSESTEEKADAKAFAEMKRLRLLQLKNLKLHGNYGLMSKELRWLCWHSFSSGYLPNDLYMEHVVAIDMQYSQLEEVWRDYSSKVILGNLKVLNLSNSHSLTKCPDFLMLPCLEELILKNCTALEDVHESIGHLKRLLLANFRGCKKVKILPESISRLKSLEKLDITGCSLLDDQEQDLLQLHEDDLFHDATEHFYPLCRLQKKSSARCKGIHIQMEIAYLYWLNSLRTLKLMDNNLLDDSIPGGMDNLVSLEHLDLRMNHFHFLPDTISCLPKLKKLQLDCCRNLQVLPDMPRSLLYLSAVNCTSLEKMSMSKFGTETQLFLTNCSSLRTISGLSPQTPHGTIHLENCNDLEDDFRQFLLKEWCGRGKGSVFLPGRNIPKWFLHQTQGSSFYFQVPHLPDHNDKQNGGVTVCVIYSSDKGGLWPLPRVSMETMDISSAVACARLPVMLTGVSPTRLCHDHMWMFQLPTSASVIGNLSSPENVDRRLKLNVDLGCGWTVKKLGVHFPEMARLPLHLRFSAHAKLSKERAKRAIYQKKF